MDRTIGARKFYSGSLLLFVGALAVAPVSGLAQLEIIGGQQARVTDNARKAANNENSDLESRTYVTARYETDPGQCQASFAGTLGYTIWQDDSFDNETDANMDLDSQCELAPRLFWDLDNNLREVSQDTTQSDTPDNRTRKNVFSTGPRYIWRIGPVDSLSFSTRYENTEFEEPEETDSERYVGSVAWTHLLSDTLSGGVSASYSATEYDTGAEVDVETVRATFSKRWATTSLSGAIGVSEIETEFGSNSRTSDGLVGEVDLTRELNPTTNWYFSAARELTDRTSSFDIRFEDFEFNLNESISVETTIASTGINKGFSDQSSLNVDVFASQSDYLETDELEERVGLNLRYSRPLAERLTGNSGFGYRYSAFDEDSSHNEIFSVELGLDYEASRDLSVFGGLGYEQENSDVPSREYDELWARLGLEYQFR
ncbi:hypothetical protein DIT72_09375 [Marinobacter orientalis]|uniref:Outer membrane beta-barrel protein n=2 Tax=Marinobacter orientalis TaxID=1928859 RepID=A0A7Y0WSI0_9GAMM|nr:outer membrane beta-barrel protein [Marinobacter orientalis]TGX50091.1 hypothetical protein DIT72_09375 [Marinobacter orientalis]